MNGKKSFKGSFYTVGIDAWWYGKLLHITNKIFFAITEKEGSYQYACKKCLGKMPNGSQRKHDLIRDWCFVPFTVKNIPVMKTGFFLCSISNREKPFFITGIPATENRFFPVWKYYTGKSLFWPCTDHVRDCSVGGNLNLNLLDGSEVCSFKTRRS